MGKQYFFLLKSGLILSFLILSCNFTYSQKAANDISNSFRIVVFDGMDFSYTSSEFKKSLRHLKYIGIDNKVSSIIVDEGTVARFYASQHYSSCSFEIVGPSKVPRLDELNCGCCSVNGNGWDNVISSVELYSNSDNRSAGVYGKFDNPPKPYPYNTSW